MTIGDECWIFNYFLQPIKGVIKEVFEEGYLIETEDFIVEGSKVWKSEQEVIDFLNTSEFYKKDGE